MRGPSGPLEGGPDIWRGQHFRKHAQRWANSGGKKKDEWKLYKRLEMQGVHGAELAWYHPHTGGKYK